PAFFASTFFSSSARLFCSPVSAAATESPVTFVTSSLRAPKEYFRPDRYGGLKRRLGQESRTTPSTFLIEKKSPPRFSDSRRAGRKRTAPSPRDKNARCVWVQAWWDSIV